jgi:hypothetical protein
MLSCYVNVGSDVTRLRYSQVHTLCMLIYSSNLTLHAYRPPQVPSLTCLRAAASIQCTTLAHTTLGNSNSSALRPLEQPHIWAWSHYPSESSGAFLLDVKYIV